VEKKSDGWSIPQSLDSIVSQGGDYAPSVATNGNLYFTYGAFRSPDWNILAWRSTGNEAPASLVAINTVGYEDGAFISPDETYLIFESDRPGGIDSSIDLYISFKDKHNTWSAPINMGEKINTKASERFARVSPDGQFLFFGSNRRLVNNDPNFDIYWIRTSVIDDLRSQISL
jgi:hypothetical protein